MLSPRSARSSRDLASPSGRERKFDALLSHQRTGSTVDRLSVPCRPPLFLGPDFLNSGLDSLASGSRRSTTSMVLRRLSTFSPRRDKARDSKALGCTGGLVVAVLRDLLMARFELDKDWVLRSVVDRDQLASQQIAFLTRIKAVASMLEQFAPLGPEASEMKEKLVLLAGHDRQLYGTVLSWLEQHQPPQVRLHLVDIADLLRTALPDEWIVLSVQHGLDANEAVAYHNAQWALEPACLPDQLSDRCLQGKPVAAWAWRGCLQGLLLPVEVQMACARLAAVKDRLKGLQAQQRVVGTGERAWSSQQMSEWLGLLELRDMFRGGEEDQPKEWALEGIWRRASQRSYLLRDATKQVMLLMGRENGPLFDPAGIRAFIRDDLLKG